MAIGDIFQIRVHQTFHGEEAMNVFYYECLSGGLDASEDVYSEFADVVWDVVRAMQSARVITRRFEVINGMNNLDFFYVDVSSEGDYDTGLDIPPQGAIGFRSPSGGPGTRYSYKRFVGAMTGMLASTGFPIWNEGVREGIMRNVCIALGANLEGASGLYQPIQITGGFQIGTPPVEGHELVGTWSLNEWMSTQRTRAAFSWVIPPAP